MNAGVAKSLRMLIDRREALTRRRVQTVGRLQALLAELHPGQAKRDITTGQAKAMLASVRPRDIAGKTHRRIAAEELAELVAVEAKIKKATAELTAIVLAPPDRRQVRSHPGMHPSPLRRGRRSRCTARGSPPAGCPRHEDFGGYVDFFLLQDLVDDHAQVRFFMPSQDLESPAVPQDVDSYREYRRLSIEFIHARNRRIDALGL